MLLLPIYGILCPYWMWLSGFTSDFKQLETTMVWQSLGPPDRRFKYLIVKKPLGRDRNGVRTGRDGLGHFWDSTRQESDSFFLLFYLDTNLPLSLSRAVLLRCFPYRDSSRLSQGIFGPQFHILQADLWFTLFVYFHIELMNFPNFRHSIDHAFQPPSLWIRAENGVYPKSVAMQWNRWMRTKQDFFEDALGFSSQLRNHFGALL